MKLHPDSRCCYGSINWWGCIVGAISLQRFAVPTATSSIRPGRPAPRLPGFRSSATRRGWGQSRAHLEEGHTRPQTRRRVRHLQEVGDQTVYNWDMILLVFLKIWCVIFASAVKQVCTSTPRLTLSSNVLLSYLPYVLTSCLCLQPHRLIDLFVFDSSVDINFHRCVDWIVPIFKSLTVSLPDQEIGEKRILTSSLALAFSKEEKEKDLSVDCSA